MTIDEAIELEKKEQIKCENDIGLYKRSVCRKHSKQKEEYHRQLAEWLEELKSYRTSVFSGDMTKKMLKEQYNKAIDDAKSVILQTLDNEILVDTLYLRLEQLKEGAGNDKSI